MIYATTPIKTKRENIMQRNSVDDKPDQKDLTHQQSNVVITLPPSPKLRPIRAPSALEKTEATDQEFSLGPSMFFQESIKYLHKFPKLPKDAKPQSFSKVITQPMITHFALSRPVPYKSLFHKPIDVSTPAITNSFAGMNKLSVSFRLR